MGWELTVGVAAAPFGLSFDSCVTDFDGSSQVRFITDFNGSAEDGIGDGEEEEDFGGGYVGELHGQVGV